MDAACIREGEFHCWLAAPTVGGVEVIDFSSRHYKRYCGGLIDVTGFDVVMPGLYVGRESPDEEPRRMTWNREDPPASSGLSFRPIG